MLDQYRADRNHRESRRFRPSRWTPPQSRGSRGVRSVRRPARTLVKPGFINGEMKCVQETVSHGAPETLRGEPLRDHVLRSRTEITTRPGAFIATIPHPQTSSSATLDHRRRGASSPARRRACINRPRATASIAASSQRQHPGHMRRRQFPRNRTSRNRDARPSVATPRTTPLDREQRGADGRGHRRPASVAPNNLAQRQSQMVIQLVGRRSDASAIGNNRRYSSAIFPPSSISLRSISST